MCGCVPVYVCILFMNVCECVCVLTMFAYVCICLRMCVGVCMHVCCTPVCACACPYVPCPCVHVCVHVCVYMYVHVYMCECMSVYVCSCHICPVQGYRNRESQRLRKVCRLIIRTMKRNRICVISIMSYLILINP